MPPKPKGKHSRSEPRTPSARRREKLVALGSNLPEVQIEVVGDRHLAFRVRKRIFAYYLFDHHGDGRIALCCKAAFGVQQGLVRRDPVRFYVPAYLGPKGWVSVRLDLDDVDWEMVAELLRDAYRHIAPKALAALVA